MKKYWVWICFLVVSVTLHQFVPVTFAKDPVRLYFFYSEESGGRKAEQDVIKPLTRKYPIEVQSFSVNKLNNYDLFTRFEKEWHKEGNALPVVIIGNNILGGEAQIRKDLEKLVKSYAERGTPWPSLQATKTDRWIPKAPTEEEKISRKVVYGAFFYLQGCLDCEGKKAELETWAPKFPDLRIATFDMTKEENKTLDEALFQIYDVPEPKRAVAVKLYIGEGYILGDDFRYQPFKKLVSKYQGKATAPPWEKVTQDALKNSEQRIIDRFKKFSLPAVLIAGLIDGLNPCAFATIIFLVSYLTFVGKKSREILVYGIIFTFGVFVAYLLAGMGLMAGLRQLSGFPLITRGIYLAISGFAFVLGVLSLYDYILFRRGRMSKWKLQLPSALKKRVHRIIREGVQSRKAGFLGTFALGFVIAATEVICTGQVYLPTIGYIMTIPKLRVHAFLNLFLYNLMFIIPLVGVFLAVFFGITSESMALAAKAHTGTVKLLTGILFIGLAGVLFLLR